MCLLFCNVDEQGKIIEAILGERIIPEKQYDYFFYLIEDPEKVSQNIPNYRIINNQLSLVES
ncbi:hypothetical protein QNH20_16400 [Neobacillus sp. WH10]|uniref:hypothetical protein n=1 Tax=Neobacillus sp. WH10 TaxID=3047873 RepID=UPI0024C148CB|nr:hypothetical protein [Neobacillus sp. WH10]WHY75700.1 hypothetical protein QNH20_16400 [Neobacillus sp. WH10]